MKTVIFFIGIFLLLLGSVNLSAQNTPKTTHPDAYSIMMMIPDSLLSNELRQTKEQIAFFFFANTNVADGKLLFQPDTRSPEYKKIPKAYIDHMLRNIDDVNNCADASVRQLIINEFPAIKKNVLSKLRNPAK